ncbi:MAG: recombinase family protein [Clostridium sp.]|nr:recombinase family protein [Clostridium sp.]
MQRAVIYARYSSDKQTEDSIEAQLRACKDYASNKQYKIIDMYIDEAVSGKTANRTQYQRLLRDCQRNKFEVILIHKYDRIARNLLEHVTLEQKLKAKNILLIATAQDFGLSNEAKIMRSLVWSMSEYYNDNLAQETKKGLKETALKGLHTGGCPPFGYDVVNQKYVINDFEAIFVRKIFDCASKRTGFVDIIQEMESCGVKGKRGKPIKYPQIYEMLRNEKYTGTFIYSPNEEKNRTNRRNKPNAIRIENAIPQIISKEQFQEVQKIMSERKQTGKTKYLCSGLVYCRCGAKMHAVKSKRKGHEYLYYNCSKHCGAPVVHMEVVDNAAKDYLHELLTKENQEEISRALQLYQIYTGDTEKDFMKTINKKVREKEKRYNNLMDTLASGAVNQTVIADITNEMETLKSEIESLKCRKPPKDFTFDCVSGWLEALKANPDEKAIHLLIERIDVKSTTDIRITSTLTSVVGKLGCGSN